VGQQCRVRRDHDKLARGRSRSGPAVAGRYHYPSGWALFAGAQVLSLPAVLTGQPYALAPLLAAGGLVGLHHWRRARRPLVRVRWPGRARRGVARVRW
jgi:hypothetical protein